MTISDHLRLKIMMYVDSNILKLLERSYLNGSMLVDELKENPKLNYLYSQSLGGADQMTLENHTRRVLSCFEQHFENKSNLILNNSCFKLLLSLHDLGKPRAVSEKQYDMQHGYTIDIIEAVSNDFRLPLETITPIMTVIDGDPIGRYLNKKHGMPLETSLKIIRKMARRLSVSVPDLWPTLLVYYQCDVSGYDSLRTKVFITDDAGDTMYFDNLNRFQFCDPIELEKFELLEGHLFSTATLNTEML